MFEQAHLGRTKYVCVYFLIVEVVKTLAAINSMFSIRLIAKTCAVTHSLNHSQGSLARTHVFDFIAQSRSSLKPLLLN